MEGFNFFSLIEPLGVITLSLLLITTATGVFRKKLRRRFMTVHKIFAWLTVVFALSHETLVIAFFG
jgi:phosphoglycerol transferase MdoB-like AlkP superfamily enzyme